MMKEQQNLGKVKYMETVGVFWLCRLDRMRTEMLYPLLTGALSRAPCVMDTWLVAP
jgi:hypothetical protein